MVDFYITIIRKNSISGLLVEAVTLDSSVIINQIHYSDNITEFTENYFKARVEETYSGPEFKTLDERFQKEFSDILIELGINDDLASFIEVMAVDKDQRLYSNWLKNVKNSLI
jgi:complement component 1 Q subcomponent-binding protein